MIKLALYAFAAAVFLLAAGSCVERVLVSHGL